MSNYKFSLSVNRYFAYRAYNVETGDVLECDDFKTLFRIAMSHARSNVYYGVDDNCLLRLVYGYDTVYEEKPGHYRGNWETITYYGFVYVSRYTEGYHRLDDNVNFVIRVKGCLK